MPGFYEGCERLLLEYTVGLKIDAVLKRKSDDLLAEAVARFEATGQPQRLFTAFWYQAGSWEKARWVVVKAEAHGPGINRREHDPLGEGHAETWRMRLIKVAAQIVVSSRRVLVRLSASWPFLNHYQAVSAAVNEACARLASDTS